MLPRRRTTCPDCGARWSVGPVRYCGGCGQVLGGTGPTSPGAGHARRAGRVRVVAGLTAGLLAVLAVTVTAGETGIERVAALLAADQRTGVAAGWPGARGAGSGGAGAGAVTLPPRPAPSGPDQPVPWGLPPRWQVEVEGAITSVEVAQGTVLVGTSAGEVIALDAHDGRRRWTTRLGIGPVHASPDSAGVVAVTAGAQLIGLDPDDGWPRWSTRLGDEAGGARPVAADDDGLLVLAGPPTARQLIAVDARDGRERWRRAVGQRVVGIGGAVVVLTETALQGFVPGRSSARWHLEVGAGEQLVGRTERHVVTRDAAGTRFRDPTTGRVTASAGPDLSWWTPGPDDGLLIAETSPAVRVLSLDHTGRPRWSRSLGGDAGCCVEVAVAPGGHVLVLDRREHARTLLLDGRDGTVVGDLSAAAAAVPGMRLIGTTEAGTGVLQGEGMVAGVGLDDGLVRWRSPTTSVVVSLDPLVLSGRRVVLAPGGDP